MDFKKKVNKDKQIKVNYEKVPHWEIPVLIVHCNTANNDYRQ